MARRLMVDNDIELMKVLFSDFNPPLIVNGNNEVQQAQEF